jgi:hypothetical protein
MTISLSKALICMVNISYKAQETSHKEQGARNKQHKNEKVNP